MGQGIRARHGERLGGEEGGTVRQGRVHPLRLDQSRSQLRSFRRASPLRLRHISSVDVHVDEMREGGWAAWTGTS